MEIGLGYGNITDQILYLRTSVMGDIMGGIEREVTITREKLEKIV